PAALVRVRAPLFKEPAQRRFLSTSGLFIELRSIPPARRLRADLRCLNLWRPAGRIRHLCAIRHNREYGV
ncbi:hypothetical protein J4734_26680, partial [Klebsiella pneumoniae]|nr:hypothetical protein [Klebsiella pneumoniae]